MITIDHLASRWDRSPESLRADIERSAKLADVITLTEVADGKRPKALITKGWTVCHDTSPWQAGEVAVLVRDDFGTVVDWATTQIGPDLGPGNAIFCIVVVIRLRAGELLLVADSHLPSSVEDKWNERRGAAYRKATRNYRHAVRRMRRKHAPNAEVVWADWNLNLNTAWVRDWVKKSWPRFAPIGKKKTPVAGTHGPRLIDWPLTRHLRKRRLSVLPRTAGSDHRGIRLRGHIR